MNIGAVRFLIVLSATLLAGVQVQAQQTGSIGGSTSPPIGFVQFCRDNPEDCVNREQARTSIQLTEASWRTIVKINADVNREITPVTDMDHWGVPEHWDYPEDGKGDCEDYVLEKRKRLVKAGFPLQTLLITVVRDQKGDGHAVLTVKTDRGDFVLDNQAGKILAWKETGYRFIKRQSDENPVRWVSLGGIDTGTVAASR
ncbi:MAG: transglutaminase [Rhizobiales bacterium PAR1]|nr:MAG: transglutaminase [Rhizobiales bacterium PAR1]